MFFLIFFSTSFSVISWYKPFHESLYCRCKRKGVKYVSRYSVGVSGSFLFLEIFPFHTQVYSTTGNEVRKETGCLIRNTFIFMNRSGSHYLQRKKDSKEEDIQNCR